MLTNDENEILNGEEKNSDAIIENTDNNASATNISNENMKIINEASNVKADETNSDEQANIAPDEANKTNCLALTLQKDHKIVAVKNVFLRTLRMSWKVIVSSVSLWILKLLT